MHERALDSSRFSVAAMSVRQDAAWAGAGTGFSSGLRCLVWNITKRAECESFEHASGRVCSCRCAVAPMLRPVNVTEVAGVTGVGPGMGTRVRMGLRAWGLPEARIGVRRGSIASDG